jgi:hypothetical protein
MRGISLERNLIIAVLLITGSAQAASVTVCPNGCDYADIQAAVDSAHPGDNINVISGSFDNVVLDKPLGFRGGRSGTYTSASENPPSIGSIYKCGYILDRKGIWYYIGKEVDGCVTPPCKKCQPVGSSHQAGSLDKLGLAEKAIKELQGSLQSTNSQQKENMDQENSIRNLLYSDDFSDANSGFSTKSRSPADYTIGYEAGRYKIKILRNDYSASAWLARPFSDFMMEAKATLEAGPNDSDYGVILRLIDKDNCYRFKVSGTGSYRFDKLKDGKWINIIPWARSNAIKTGKATNLIKVECIGDKFRFYANGVKLRDCSDNSYASGNVGLTAVTHMNGGAQASFDNLRIWDI